MDPLAYRVLLMLASVYRLWEKIRLAQLQPWIALWALPKIYAGIRGQGANDAAYATAVEIEYCRVHKISYTGGAADIFKCFDQIRREIVYKVLKEASERNPACVQRLPGGTAGQEYHSRRLRRSIW